MSLQQQNDPAVAKLLPQGWNLQTDVLLIVGEGAGPISDVFIRHGCQRVFAMLPNRHPTQATTTGAVTVHTRGELHRAIQTMAGPPPTNFAMVRTPSCSLPKKNTAELHSLTTNFLKSRRAQQHIQDALGPKWAKNCLSNLAHIGKLPTVTDLGQAFENLPLIIVGAGPSLSKNIDQLKAARGKAIIVCAARALRSLQAAGVYPDFAISLDATDVRSHFRDTDIAEIPCVLASASSHPSLFSLTGTCLMSFSSNTQAEAWMFDPQDALVEMPTGGSVSCSAFSIALHWGCDPIILVGQDLSFEGGQFYHQGGTDGQAKASFDPQSNTWRLDGYSEDLAHTLRDQINEKGLRFNGATVPGYYGGEVATNEAFASFRTWFEFTARDHAATTTLFNCTEGGAFIGGMQHVPLRDVLSELSPKKTEVRPILADLSGAPARKDQARRFGKKEKDTKAAIVQATSLAKQCIAIINKAKRKPSMLAQLPPLEKELSAAMKRAFVLNLVAQNDIRQAVEAVRSAKNIRTSLAASKKLYQIIVDHGSTL
jgi:hypothetical protein